MYTCKWIEATNNATKSFDTCNYTTSNKPFLTRGKGTILHCKDILIYTFGWHNSLKSNKFMLDKYYIAGFLLKLTCWKTHARVCSLIILLLFKRDVLLYIKLWEFLKWITWHAYFILQCLKLEHVKIIYYTYHSLTIGSQNIPV